MIIESEDEHLDSGCITMANKFDLRLRALSFDVIHHFTRFPMACWPAQLLVKGATLQGFRGFLAHTVLKLVVANLIHSEHYL